MNGDIRKQILNLPNKPGVYLFRDSQKKILYIGKAASIKKRVQSYFRDHSILMPRTERLVTQIKKIDHIETGSEIEALLFESHLIKKQQPKYNVAGKDDKSNLYIKIEKGEFPRVLAVRGIDDASAQYFGPFLDARAVRKTVNFLRRIFPFRTCEDFPKRPCLLYHMKRCPAPCIDKISKKDYQKNIKRIILFLSGKQTKIIKDLKREMKSASKKEEFEKAAHLRDKIFTLEHISRVSVLQHEIDQGTKNGLFELIMFLKKYYPKIQVHTSFRIEAYDISNISGTTATGSMVVFTEGAKDSDGYRKFGIKTVFQMNDIACMKEVLRRRFSHKDEWILPDLIVLDGGKGQLRAARETLAEFRLNIPHIGLAKKQEEIYLPQSQNPIVLPKDSPALLLLEKIRDEAHRFAKNYHLKLRSKKMLGKS